MDNNNELTAGECIKAPNGDLLSMQSDGNLVAYRGSSAISNTETFGNNGAKAAFQGDGNLVVYSSDGHALWALSFKHENKNAFKHFLHKGSTCYNNVDCASAT